ncbi:Tyrosine-protein phosphatase non-receptor type 23 [Chelonia mydas]|uniref:Tyrosine-protein phosphatase non-receptor type 23 n=1 Tax=Chelonia mydas TaxID=8469 RepID=M7AXV6_CHEMY|nr:Tyrosine-protein phosphatase non-receptor type 23 [Chelonia mydas]
MQSQNFSQLFVLKNYGENPESYNEELKKLELLRQSAVSVPRDFEGCSILRKYFGQLHYLQSRVPMGPEHEAAVPITWTEIFSGKAVTHEDIKYEQACILYNLGALHSMLGAMDKRVSEEGMKVSCTHFQCAAGAFTYLRDHFPHSYSVDMSHQILNLNINLMLGQAQECLLEKSMLDNRKSFLVARISAQVVDYYKEACRALEDSGTASLLGKIQKGWKKLVQMKIYYFAAVAHLHMGKQAEEQQKFGERVVYFQSALDKLNEAIKLAKGQPETVQEALRFTLDVIGGKYNSAKKDNDFIYHEAVPALDTLQSVKGATLVKALPVNPTDPAVTGPDIFAKLVPMAAHEASSLYSEEKAKLLREVMAKIEAKNEVLDQFMDSMQLDPETVDNLEMYNHIPPILMEKCAALSVRPDTVKNLVQSMQVLSGVFTDVEASLKEIRDLLDDDELQDQKLQELLGKPGSPPSPSPGLAEVSKEWAKYMEVHEKASFTNTELHKAMNLHISNLRLLSGPLEQVRTALPAPALTEDDKQVLQNLKRILSKVQEMKDQRMSLEQQLREMIQKDDITTSLVTTDRSEMRKLFDEQLKKYDQIKVYLEQNLAAQENVLKALTDANVKYAAVRKVLAEVEHNPRPGSAISRSPDANVKYAAVRKVLAEVEHKWNTTLQTLVASYEAYEDLMKKSQEGKDFYADLESKAAKLLEKARAACQASEASRQQVLEREMKKKPPPRPTAPKPALQKKASERDLDLAAGLDGADLQQPGSLSLADLPEELRSLPPDVPALSQMQGGVIVPGPAIPSPAPSPQPSLAIQPPAILPSSVPGAPSLPQRPPPSLTPGAAPLAQGPAEVQFHRQSSSTDDLLSSSPESQHGGSKTAVSQPLLQPTKADAKEGQKPKAVQLIENDPYEKPEHIMRLLSELDRFRGVVASLERPVPGSVPELDGIWKELQDAQERDARQLSIAIARCYSMKNRHQDIMPYDKNRIVLQSGKDDYINASKVEDLSSYCPTIIATQAPLVGTASDFWLMIYEQKVSLLVMLVSEQELEKQKVVRYFPLERGQPMVQGPITLILTSLKVAPTHVERMITLQFRDQSLKRTVIHLQFTAWPELGLPDSKGNLLRFIQDVHGHYLHQRPLHTPIVVHCSSGVGRTGAFCLMYAAVQEVEAENSIPDLARLVKRMRQQRKHMLQEKLHLKFCYEAVLKHAEQVLQRHGVTTPAPSKAPSSAAQKLYLHQDPQDLVLGGDMPISSIQATIAKLSIKPPGGSPEPPPNWQLPEPAAAPEAASPGAIPAAPDSVAQPSLTEPVPPTSAELPPAHSAPTMPVPLPEAESSNHVEERPSREPSAPSLAPSSSSLELLASLTPEAFSLDSSLKGKPRMSKQSFLQPQNGEGLRGPRPSDDPLSMLDPLWTLNKT